MENKKLKINVNLKTGKYVFDNGDEIIEMPISRGDESILKRIIDLEDMLEDEYGFSDEMISRADPILYEKLMSYDYKYNTRYTTKYLNMLAKEIEKKSGESIGEYKKRCMKIRGDALRSAGIELSYTTAKISKMTEISLFDKLRLIRMAKKQKVNGVSVSNQFDYENLEEPVVHSIKEEKPERVATAESIDPKKVDKTIFATDTFDQDILSEPKMKIPSFLEDVLDKKKSDDNNTQADSEQKTKVTSTKTIEPKAKKTVSRRKSIQASKRAMRESRKMKNVYLQKQSQLANKPKTTTTQSQKSKAQKTAEYKAKHQAPKKAVVKPQENEQKKKEIQYYPIKNGKMLGIDENRPSAVVKTFVIEVPKKDNKAVAVEQNDVKPEVVIEDATKKERRAQRYTRKIKDESDSIKNRIATSKDRFKKIAAVVAATAVVIAAGVIMIPRAVASIPLGNEYESAITIQAYDGVEQIAVKEVEVDAEAPAIGMSEASANIDLKTTSYIRNVESQNTGKASEEAVFSEATVKTVENIQEDDMIESKIELEGEIMDLKAQPELKEMTSALSEDSLAYLESVRVGTSMKIDSGKYYETPEGTGKYGNFENHAGEKKIIDKIGISTDAGYISISSGDLSLLDLKQMYPEAKFSYHIVDEEGHILGWLTSESFENVVEKQVGEMDR